MVSVEKIVNIINSLGYKTYKFDYGIYTNYILSCFNWYKGFDAGFHNYSEWNGFIKRRYEKARLNMGKRVCEDKASLTVNENINFEIEDARVREFLLGNNEMTGVLGQNDFWTLASKTYEITNALGTGAFEIVVENLLKAGNNIIAHDGSKIKLVGHNALDIIPLSWDSNGNITEIAFTDQYKEKDTEYIDLRLHVLDENGFYKIINKKLRACKHNKDYVALENETVLDEFNTGSNIPWFSVLKLPIINNYYIDSPMGASILANCIDILKSIDDAFNILCTEYKYGTKKLFYHKRLLQRDSNGNLISPDDTNSNIFYYMGDDLGADAGDKENKLIHEFNPNLRIDEISKGMENGLNYLSVVCGLGNGYYKFTAGTVQKTATEVVSENSAMYRNIHKDQMAVEKCFLGLFKSAIYVHNLLYRDNLDINAVIKIKFDASITEDKVSIRERDLLEVEKGIMTIEEYRAKYYDSDRRDS